MENNLENPYDLDVPRLYEAYDYVDDNGMAANSTWYGDIIDRERLAIGNVFSVHTSVSKVRQAEAAVRMAFKSIHVAKMESKVNGIIIEGRVYECINDGCDKRPLQPRRISSALRNAQRCAFRFSPELTEKLKGE